MNSNRVGTLLSLPKEYGSNYSLEMNYSATDPKSSLIEKKTLKIEKNSKDDNTVRFDLNCFSDEGVSNMGINIQHSDMIVIQRLVEFALPYMIGWHALEGRGSIEEDLEEGNTNFKNDQ